MLSTSSYLQNRNGNYHLRFRTPIDLRGAIPQREIVKTLKTTNLKTAKDPSLPYILGTNKALRPHFLCYFQLNTLI